MYMRSHSGVSVKPTWWRACVLLVTTAVLASGCDKAQLLAPTRSTITISAPTQILATGASTEITAYVIEQAGTAVQNGTTVRFTTTLGTLAPENAQTRNGVARAVFSAGSTSGIAEIRATSGAATGGTDNVNLVRIAVGAAAVGSVTLRANPGSVGPSGGSVELIASAVSESGQGIEGIIVTFSADQGSLSTPTATTNASGEARVTLTTGQETTVIATA
jgi:adhesin/invasin